MTTAHDSDLPEHPLKQIKPRWIAENLGAATLGFGLGHLLGGGAAGLVGGLPAVQGMSPQAKRRLLQGVRFLAGTGGAATGFSANQMRIAMSERLRAKRLEQERKKAPSQDKVASVLRERGWA